VYAYLYDTYTQKCKKLMSGKWRDSFNLPFPFNIKYSVLDVIILLSPHIFGRVTPFRTQIISYAFAHVV